MSRILKKKIAPINRINFNEDGFNPALSGSLIKFKKLKKKNHQLNHFKPFTLFYFLSIIDRFMFLFLYKKC